MQGWSSILFKVDGNRVCCDPPEGDKTFLLCAPYGECITVRCMHTYICIYRINHTRTVLHVQINKASVCTHSINYLYLGPAARAWPPFAPALRGPWPTKPMVLMILGKHYVCANVDVCGYGYGSSREHQRPQRGRKAAPIVLMMLPYVARARHVREHHQHNWAHFSP